MRFSSLGSGSSGNATLIQSGNTLIMLDCGFACKETVKRLEKLNVQPEHINAILVTHEHSDHISGVGVFSRKYQVPVWMNYGTYRQRNLGKMYELNLFDSFQLFQIGNIQIQPFVVPHDSREAVQFVFQHQHKRLGILTDLGHISPHIIGYLQQLHALVVEANHCPVLLQQGSYSHSLKRRVGGDYGHLNNYQAAELVKALDTSSCQHIIAAHLSQENNHPEQAKETFKEVLKELPACFEIASQDSGFDWKLIQ